jgi:Alpha/beta hydrolase domain
MVKWIQNGTPPPTAPRIAIATFGNPSIPVRNSLGLAQGGIQLSQMVLPTRINVGTNTGPGACNRWGYSAPIDPATLQAMYPDPVGYYGGVGMADKPNLISGYILLPDVAADLGNATAGNVSGLYDGQ